MIPHTSAFVTAKPPDGQFNDPHGIVVDANGDVIVADTRNASISYLQRRLKVGYNRAARMIEQMENDGIVGPQEGTKPREVFVSSIQP